MPVRVTIQETLKTPPSTMRASFDPRPILDQPEETFLAKVAETVPEGAAGADQSDPVAKGRAYAESFGAALAARLGPERAAIAKLNFEQQLHYLARVLGLEMKAAGTQWVALVWAKRGLDAYCGPAAG